MKEAITHYLKAGRIALVGVSRNDKKFGNNLFKELISAGKNVIPVHPELKEVNGVKCYPGLETIDKPVDAILLNIKPDKTMPVLRTALKMGIKNVWFQPGSQSEEALNFCRENNINAVSKFCFLLFQQPAGFHKFHRFFFNIFNKELKEV